MSEKKIKTRIQHKHDSKVNWSAASGFIPLPGELIIYDKEVDADGRVIVSDRFKVGDGVNNVEDLPFADATLLERLGVLEEATNTLKNTHNTDKDALEAADAELDDRVALAETDIDILQETVKGLSGAMHFKGVVDVNPTDISFDVSSYKDGDVVIFGNKEYVFNTNAFVEFGDATANASAITKLTEDLSEHSGNTKNPHNVVLEQLTYTNTEPMIQDVNGILASNHTNGFNNVSVTDLITELLYPYTAPVISSFSLNPSAGAKEMNVDLTVNSATVKVTKKSKAIESVSLYKGNTLIETKTDEITSSGTTLTFTIDETLDGSTDTNYQIKVTENNGSTISSSNQIYDFVYPYFYGVIENGTTIDSATVLGFTKGIRAKGGHSYSYTTNNQCPVIAYPKSYGVLKSIIDPNNFTQTWTQSVVTIDNDDTINGVDYYVYVGGPATLTASYKFNY
jgi:hypothetical protein